MKTSELGIAIIKHNEGFVGVLTPDNGHMAIGHGHDILPGEDFSAGITRVGADTLLRKDLELRFEPHLNATLARMGITPNQNQFDALIDFCYNLGESKLDTMLAHGWDEIAKQIPRWCLVEDPETKRMVESEGLLERRHSEVDLFFTPING